ncbi:MAG: hypothetical protein JSU80_06855 [Deltaproteobacteria bacterium]|nr:MAG: hypothetical protein JSU80_06855 [Deltaproteobacteria bacterium]
MASQGEVYDRVEGIVAKLYVLRDSCTGIIHTERSNPNLIWFQGSETLLEEAVDGLQGVLRALETGEEIEPAVVEEEEAEAPSEGDEEKEEAPAEETE